ncbi:MAG TPA: hypothetical protein VK250_09225 [Nitrososphaeraceae archaeon]|nr:hypothetical protein [Nitrososphaeraceae archaeon]
MIPFTYEKKTDKISSSTSSTFEYFNQNDNPYGFTYGQWTVKWWRWIWSIPDSTNPLRDDDGTYADINQPEKDVWFLVGTWATEKMTKVPNRDVTIPFDRSILFPVINCEANPIEYPYLKTDEDIVNHVVKDENTIVLKEAYIDSMAIPIQRVRSDPILFPLKVPHMYNPRGYVDTKASADGYWVFLKPLPVGTYNIKFSGACEMGRLNTAANYKITIKK